MSIVRIFDTETTDRQNGEVIEAAWLLLASTDLVGETETIIPGLPIADEFSQRYRPARAISFGSMAVHHILPSELIGCDPSSTFQLPPDTEYIVGHSIDCDWQVAGSPAGVKRICTHAMAQWIWAEADGYSQSALIYLLEGANPVTRFRLKQAHSALTDARLNRTLLAHILERRLDITTWSQLWAFSEECRLPRTCPHHRYRGVPITDLDTGYLQWWLALDSLNEYTVRALVRELERRNSSTRFALADLEEDADDGDGQPF